ncbi:MAG: dTDP-4-dehydrorhamnose reductase [Candidatus Woesebacteria bacterium GW2011_GWA2_40_7b]|uniref:dTDP-4-dehydrorhamnose reductase n=1 Tax=Candidatus Woesebacteria bacterium GW2011_GWA2_40_7b TaxID=1618563 RepID=A0A0G0SZC8_9BACT|nr:MAG: dTDP-4-dehydrorhamnose reductase [Candidatus Woesebacteria bacterium GW2011_GWA2_40_7b]
MKKILVTGASGLVGSRFIELFKGRYDFVTPEYPQFDLTNKEGVLKIVRSVNPDVVVNFAAYTNVSEAENQKGDESSPCWKINVEGVKNILDALPQKTHFIQISTDNVFPGSENDPGPYSEDHPTDYKENELTWYGRTKSLGEKEVTKKLGKDATILRLIYPSRSKYDMKSDYLRKPLSLFDEGKLYPMFNDQQVSISFVDSIAEALDKIIDGDKRGVFHASSEDTGTPFEIITYLIEKARGVKNAVKPSSLAEFVKTVDNPVRYPKFGGLRVEKTEKELGIKFGNWKNIVDEFVGQLNSPSNT